MQEPYKQRQVNPDIDYSIPLNQQLMFPIHWSKCQHDELDVKKAIRRLKESPLHMRATLAAIDRMIATPQL
jgi:hypothetical protein